MANHLSGETSPYLLQHADNPVDWYPWGSEALAKAMAEDKPIFLSIGYAACHWCHVMAHESFEDPSVASIMNAFFVNIKVDREERPDLDNIYMSFVVATTGQGGWPMSLFLTPEGKPFFGGTYLPPKQMHNLPAFREVLETVAQLWKEDRSRLLSSSEELSAWVQSKGQSQVSTDELTPHVLDQAATIIAEGYDWQNGGWGSAPKFPQPMLIEFLLRRASAGDQACLHMATHCLKAMIQGGMYDLVGGGFARYSVDPTWLIPHFEKMLYDNAQLARIYLHAYQLTGEPAFREVTEATLDFVLRELTHPQGGFYSSLDADSDGEEGKYYLWTTGEIRAVLKDSSDVEIFLTVYGLNEKGNFEGKNILRQVGSETELASRYNLPEQTVHEKLKQMRKQLLEARSQRVCPATDDKVLASWNGLMFPVFALAGRVLGNAHYLQAAIQNADFLIGNLINHGQLFRSWRQGITRHAASLEDYAGLALGLLSLYQADPNPRWFQAAKELVQHLLEHFPDPAGGFFDTSDSHETLLYRPKDLQDNATPSGNAQAVIALLRLAAFEGRNDWRGMAEEAISANLGMIRRYPSAHAQWLCAADDALSQMHEVAIIGDPEDQATESFLQLLWRGYYPHVVVAAAPFPPPEGSPALLNDRSLLNSRPTAYVCRDFVCQKPVNDPQAMLAQL